MPYTNATFLKPETRINEDSNVKSFEFSVGRP